MAPETSQLVLIFLMHSSSSMSDSQTDALQAAEKRYDILAILIIVSLVLLGLGGWLTYLGLGPWYEQLCLPPFQPPAWVFTPTWTLVLTLLAVATWFIARNRENSTNDLAIGLYGMQCVLNVGWSLLFFTLQRPDAALWELLVLDVTLVLMIWSYWKVSRLGSVLLVPYLAWLLLATAINFWIVQNNDATNGRVETMTQAVEHEPFMRKAISIAEGNAVAPFGALLVDRSLGRVVARGVNRSHANPTLHGEIAAINDYVDQGGTNWKNLTLYTTAEPCCMCQGAIVWAGISEVVFGTSISELKQLGWRQIDIPAQEVVSRGWKPGTEITGGVLANECGELFRRARLDP